MSGEESPTESMQLEEEQEQEQEQAGQEGEGREEQEQEQEGEGGREEEDGTRSDSQAAAAQLATVQDAATIGAQEEEEDDDEDEDGGDEEEDEKEEDAAEEPAPERISLTVCDPDALARCNLVLVSLMRTDGADPVFCTPIEREQFPQYYDVMHGAMDLETVRKKLIGIADETGEPLRNNCSGYCSANEFAADVRLTLLNCIWFHASAPFAADAPIVRLAQRLRAKFERLMDRWVKKPPSAGDEDLRPRLDTAEDTCCCVCREIPKVSSPEDIHQLVCCDGCDALYHHGCLEPPLNTIPAGEWYCNYCTSHHHAPARLGARPGAAFAKVCMACHCARKTLYFCRAHCGHTAPDWQKSAATYEPVYPLRHLPSDRENLRMHSSVKYQCQQPGCSAAFSSTPAAISHSLHCNAGAIQVSPAACSRHDAEEAAKKVCLWVCDWCGCDAQILLRDGYSSQQNVHRVDVAPLDKVVYKADAREGSSAIQVPTLQQKIADLKRPGPEGDGTLCTPCGARYANAGKSGKPWVTQTRRGSEKFACALGCKGSFESIAQLSLHEAECKGAFSSHWVCWWCGCPEGATSCKAPGPDMADQLCLLCSQEYKRGALVPLRRKKGGYKCPLCFRACPTVATYNCHRQLCALVDAAKHPHLVDSCDDLVYFTRKLACAESNGTTGRLACTPPPVAMMLDPRVPNWLIPDLISLADTIHRFGPELSLPHMSVQEIIGVACLDTKRQEHGNKHLLWLADEMHLRLTMLVMELAHVTPLPNGPAYFRYHQKHFAHIGPDGLDGAAAVMQRCLDALTWEAVLWQYVKHNVCDEYGDERCSASPMVGVVEAVGLYGYEHLYVEQRIMLLKFLINEVLGSEYTRKVLLDNANALEEHDRKRREDIEAKRQNEKIFFAQNPGAKRKSALDSSKMSQLEKKRARSAKEAERRKAAKQAKIDEAAAAAAASAAAASASQVSSTTLPVVVGTTERKANEPGKIKNERIGGNPGEGRRVSKSKNVTASVLAPPSNPAAPSKSVSRRSSASSSSRQSLTRSSSMEAVRACVNAMVQKIIKEDVERRSFAHEIDEEENMPLRLEPLGEDREYNTYWWSASDPGRLWVETGSRPTRSWPPATRAYAEGAKSTNERIDAARETIVESVKAIPTIMLREMAALCGVFSRADAPLGENQVDKLCIEADDDGFDDTYESFSRDQLIEHIFANDCDGTVVTCALEQCEADAARVRMAQAPKAQLVELLDLADIKWKPGMTRRELARLPTNAALRKMLVDALSDGYASEDEETPPIVVNRPPKSMFSSHGSTLNQAIPEPCRGPSRQKRRRSNAKLTGQSTKNVPGAAAATTDGAATNGEIDRQAAASPSPQATAQSAGSTAKPGDQEATLPATKPTASSKTATGDSDAATSSLAVSAAPSSAAGSAIASSRSKPEDGHAQRKIQSTLTLMTQKELVQKVLRSPVVDAGSGANFVGTALASARAASENALMKSTRHAQGSQLSKRLQPFAWQSAMPPVRPESPPPKRLARKTTQHSTGSVHIDGASASESTSELHQKIALREHSNQKQLEARQADDLVPADVAPSRSLKRSHRHHESASAALPNAPAPTIRRTDHASWSGEENAMLRCLVFEHGEGNWVRKHRQLGTNRTPAEVEEHWNALRPEQSGRSPTRAEKTIRKAIAARRTRADVAEQQAESMQVSLTENNNPPNPVPNTETVWGHYSTLEQLRDLLRYLDARGPRERRLLIRMRRILPQLTAAMAMGRRVNHPSNGTPGAVIGVDTRDFELRPREVELDFHSGLDIREARGLRLIIQYEDANQSRATLPLAQVLSMAGVLRCTDSSEPYQQSNRRQQWSAASRDGEGAQGMSPRVPAYSPRGSRFRAGGSDSSSSDSAIVSCQPGDLCVARQPGICPKTGKTIVAWKDLVVWGRDAADLSAEVVFCHASSRAAKWPKSDELRRHYTRSINTGAVTTDRYCGSQKAGPQSVRMAKCMAVLFSIQDAVENLFGKAPESRKKTATWRRGAELAADLQELISPSCVELAEMMVFVGAQLRRPRDGHDQWDDWLQGWRSYALSTHSDAQRTLAIYALRERALLLGLPPPPGAAMESLPLTKPTPRPRADALVVSLTTDLATKGSSAKSDPADVADDGVGGGSSFTGKAAKKGISAMAPPKGGSGKTGKSKNADLSGFGKRKSSDSNGGGSGGSNGDGKRVAKKEAGRLAAMEALVGTGPMSSDTLLDWIEELKKLLERDDAYLFAEPVDRGIYPEYYEVIDKPMDLGTVMERLQGGDYVSAAAVYRDVDLVFANCKAYNQPDSEVGKAGRRMQSAFSRVVRSKLAARS